MVEAYYVGKSMIVPQENIDVVALQDIFRRLHSLRVDEEEIKLREVYAEVTRALPDFLDREIHYVVERLSFFGEKGKLRTDFNYKVPLQLGRVSGKMCLAQDLGDCLRRGDFYSIRDERIAALRETLAGKSGIVVSGQYRSGTDINDRLRLKIHFSEPGKARRAVDIIPESVIGRVLNALCELKPLYLQEELGIYDNSPLSIYGREVYANIKDMRLEKLREAEPHITEFFSWISAQAQALQTVLVMGSVYQVVTALENDLRESRQLQHIALETMPAYVQPTLESITSLMSKLHPPQNKRMDYLVSSQ